MKEKTFRNILDIAKKVGFEQQIVAVLKERRQNWIELTYLF
jgi:hypothetical protein